MIDKTVLPSLIAFSPTGISPTLRQGTIRRAGTLVRGPLDSAKKEKEKEDGGKMPGSEVSSEFE
jgi:hypothetical protein